MSAHEELTMRTCPRCHGDGLDYTRAGKDGEAPSCVTCNGSGEIRKVGAAHKESAKMKVGDRVEVLVNAIEELVVQLNGGEVDQTQAYRNHLAYALEQFLASGAAHRESGR